MSLSLSLRLDSAFLAGGDHEHTPYACVRANWAGARFSLRTSALRVGEWVDVGQVTGPPPSMVGDPMIYVNLYAHTSYSGVKELDESDKGHTLRQIACGTAGFALLGPRESQQPVLDHYVATSTFRTILQAFAGGSVEVLANPVERLGAERVKFAETAALNYALKGQISMRVRGQHGAVHVEAPPSPAFFERMDAAYWLRATDLPPPEGADMSKRFPCNPTEPMGTSLHIVQWDTPTGRAPATAFARRTPGGPVCPKCVEAQLLAAMLRHGMRSKHFVDTVEKQFKEDALLSSTLSCLEVLENFGAFPSNATQYGADRRYPNIDFYKKQPESIQRLLAPQLFPGQTGAPGALVDAHELPTGKLQGWLSAGLLGNMIAAHYGRLEKPGLAAAHLEASTAKPEEPVALEEQLCVPVESWDTAAPAGELNTCDCEDSGFGGMAPIKALQSLKAPTSSLLRAAQRLLSILHVWGTGSTVTAQYLKDDGSAGTKHVPTPVVGSIEDKDYSEGGHAFAGLESKAKLAAKRLRGLALCPMHPTDEPRVRQRLEEEIRSARAWQKQLPALLLEGTAPGLRFPLPAEETFRGTDREDLFVRRAATKIAFIRACRNKLSPAHELLLRFCKMPSQTYEVRAMKNLTQRVSPFYRTILHLLLPDDETPQLSQMMAVRTDTRERGVTMGDYMRDPVDGGKVALVGPYADLMSSSEWHATVGAYEDYMLAQQPIGAWGCHDPAPPSLVGRVMSGEQIRELAGSMSVSLAAVPRQPLAREGHAIIGRIERADEGSTHVALPLYAPTWRFTAAGAGKTGELLQALGTLEKQGAIAGHAWLRDVPMKHLPEQVELLLLLPVCSAVDEKMFPVT